MKKQPTKPEAEPESKSQQAKIEIENIFGTKPNESELHKMVDSWGQRIKPKTKK